MYRYVCVLVPKQSRRVVVVVACVLRGHSLDWAERVLHMGKHARHSVIFCYAHHENGGKYLPFFVERDSCMEYLCITCSIR